MGKKLVKFVDGEMIEYEIRELVDFYDPILRKPTRKLDLEQMSPRDISYYIFSMAMMLDHYQNALGLSANQVGWPFRICAVNLGKENIIFLNPEIVEASEPTTTYYEGCVSYPGLYVKVPRSQRITIKFQTPTGKWNQATYEGLTAICIQHELDHLDGIVYTDKISPINLEKAKRKVKSNLKKMKKFEINRASQQKMMEPDEISVNAPPLQTPQTIELPQIIVPEELKAQKTPTSFVYKTE